MKNLDPDLSCYHIIKIRKKTKTKKGLSLSSLLFQKWRENIESFQDLIHILKSKIFYFILSFFSQVKIKRFSKVDIPNITGTTKVLAFTLSRSVSIQIDFHRTQMSFSFRFSNFYIFAFF